MDGRSAGAVVLLLLVRTCRAHPEHVRVECAEQVVDAVQHRGGVRLDRHPVTRLELFEPQRRHDRDHRRPGRLGTIQLQADGIEPDPVEVMVHRGGQPQHSLLDRFECLQVHRTATSATGVAVPEATGRVLCIGFTFLSYANRCGRAQLQEQLQRGAEE